MQLLSQLSRQQRYFLSLSTHLKTKARIASCSTLITEQRSKHDISPRHCSPNSNASPFFTSPHSRHLSTSTSTSTKPNIHILFGSQTGTAQLFAQELQSILVPSCPQNTVVVSPLDSNPSLEPKTPNDIFLILISCTGQGEAPGNARSFFESITKDGDGTKLDESTRYAVFGLGNSLAYSDSYNRIGKVVDKRLEELGANRIYELGLGDDSGCIEEDFDDWSLKLADILKKDLDASEKGGKVEEKKEEEIQMPYAMVQLKTPPENYHIHEDLFHTDFYAPETRKLRIVEKKRVARSHEGMMEMKMSLNPNDYDVNSGTNLYNSGDHVLVYPQNHPALVKSIIGALNLDQYQIIEPEENINNPYQYPKNLTVYETFTHCIDITATIPSLSLSRILLDKQQINYKDEILNPQYSVLELLLQNKNTDVNLSQLLHHLPQLQPRFYSISSSPLLHPNDVLITYRPLYYTTSRGTLRDGLCTSFLNRSMVGATLPVKLSPNPTFRLPSDPKKPCLYIAGGCGLAPIRAFMEHRIEEKTQNPDIQYGESYAFLGFRNEDDEAYRELFLHAKKIGALTDVFVSYSEPYCYLKRQVCTVSHEVKTHGAKIFEMLEMGAHLYVCGGAGGLAPSCRSAVREVLRGYGLEDAEVEDYFGRLRKEGRYAEDVAN